VAGGPPGGVGTGGVADVPAFGGADGRELVEVHPVAGEPGGPVLADDGVDVGDPLESVGGGESGPGLGPVLEEVFLPEGAAAEDAGAAGLHRHLDLLEVVGVIDAGREEDPGALAGLGEGVEVVDALGVGLVAEGAGELGLVDVAEPADLAGGLDGGLGLAVEVGPVGLLLAVVGERDRFEEEEDVVLQALGVDVLD